MKHRALFVAALFSLATANVSISARAQMPESHDHTASIQDLNYEIRELQETSATDSDKDRRILHGNYVRSRISQFIVEQLTEVPAISKDQLQTQLQRILCASPPNPSDCLQPPQVFADHWNPKTQQRQIVVAYVIYLGFMGAKGSLVTIESYLWEAQTHKACMTARGGNEFNGRAAQFELLAWYPTSNEYWIFASGPPLGWSGRAYPGKAGLYSIKIDEVKTIWETQTLPNLKIQRNELGWEMTYADPERFFNWLPNPYVFDVYRFNYTTRQFRRVIRYRYSGPD